MARIMKVEVVGLSEERLSSSGKPTRNFSGWVATNEGRLWVTGYITKPDTDKTPKTTERFEKLFE